MGISAFHDLYDKDKADLMLIKSYIIIEIEGIVKEYKLSRRNLEKILDIPQPQVSELMTGKFHKISIDRLITYLNRLAHNLKIERVININIKAAENKTS